MANITINELPERTPALDSYVLGTVMTAPGQYTTSRISIPNLIAAANLNIANWQSSVETLTANAPIWNTTVSILSSKQDGWDSFYSLLASNSGQWSGAYATLLAFKPNWDSNVIATNSLSANVNVINTICNNTLTTVASNSAQWSQPNLQKFVQPIGDSVTYEYPIAHNLGTTDIVTQVYSVDNMTGKTVIYPSLSVIDPNTIIVGFDTPPPVGRYRVVVIG